jgi:hypothetical protein
MNKVNGSFTFFLVVTLGLACGGSGLGTSGPGTGGHSGASGGAPGLGGAGSGGVLAAGGAWGSGGVFQGSGGRAAGGVIGSGGSTALGGRGGANAGGSTLVGGRGGANAGGSAVGGASGAGGTTCATPVACPAIGCLYGAIPNPDPCGCPICAQPDAGTVKDASADGPCLALPCALPICGYGWEIVTPPCGCPTCVPVDAGPPDSLVCPLIVCPAVKCAAGTVPSSDPCGCPTCALVDAGTETKADATKLACVDLDECSCMAANGCGPIGETCYCPFPQCGSGACKCGGGKFIGCAPVDLTACANAEARVGNLCPQLAGATFDNLCNQTDTACITKCLNDVTSCADVFCTFCEACDCATDNFLTCVGKCSSGLAQ